MFQSEKLVQIVGKEHVRQQEEMAKHTTFRIGGPAQYFIEPQNITQMVEVIAYLKETQMPYYIMGNGSNLLISDQGYQGVMISAKSTASVQKQQREELSLADYMVCPDEEGMQKERDKFIEDGYTTKEQIAGKTLVYAGCGIILVKLANVIAEYSLTGFEFAAGIPGTLGGAVTMNAGAYGGEIKDCILGARVLLEDGTVTLIRAEELQLGYRSSIIQKRHLVVLDTLFAFETGNKTEIQNRMRDLNAQRREKQPLEYGSAGSTFKRPEGYFAGKLIQDAGLKGYRVGDVMVSEKHSGFVVNVGNGTCEEAMAVIKHVQNVVKEKYDVMLELEVRCL